MAVRKRRALKKKIAGVTKIYCGVSGVAVGSWLVWALPQAAVSLWSHLVSWSQSLSSLLPSF